MAFTSIWSPKVCVATEADAEAQLKFSSLLVLAKQRPESLGTDELIGSSASRILDEYDGVFHELYELVKGGRYPAIAWLGVWGNTEDKPAVYHLENTTRTLAIQCHPVRKAPPFHFVEYNHRGDEVWSTMLPAMPPTGAYRLINPVGCRWGTIRSLHFRYTTRLEWPNYRLSVNAEYGLKGPKMGRIAEAAFAPCGWFWTRPEDDWRPLWERLLDEEVLYHTGKQIMSLESEITSVRVAVNWSKFCLEDS